MKTYVQSRGKSQEHDHCWLECREGNQQLTVPLELKEIQPGELIDSQKPSIILARSHNHLILLITALQTQDGRTDFMGRQIRNSVAWIATDGGDKEQLFRKIAIQALEGNLAKAVDEAVTNDADSDYGFTVDFDKLKELKKRVDKDQAVRSQRADDPDLLKVGGPNQQSGLISDLKEYVLPKSSNDIQILVVVTTMKSENGLKAKGVWRGLSSRIESEDWKKFRLPSSEESDLKNREKKLFSLFWAF